MEAKDVITPTGSSNSSHVSTRPEADTIAVVGETFSGLELKDDACGVSIMRGGKEHVLDKPVMPGWL
jgi:hypothetical protein